MTQVLEAAPQSTMAEDSAQPGTTQPSQPTIQSIDTQPAPPRKSGPRPTIGGAQPTRIPQPHLQPTRIPAPRQSAQHAKQRLHEQYEEATRNGHKQTTRGRSPKKSAKAKGKAKARPPNAASQTLTLALKWVQDVLDLKDRFDRIWSKAFQSDRDLESSLNEVCISVVGLCRVAHMA